MSLPRPPKELARFVETSALHCALNDMVQAYGQQCRDAALEEAADACELLAQDWGDVAEESGMARCAKQIRSLK